MGRRTMVANSRQGRNNNKLPSETLTAREVQVMELITQGYMDREIALQLGISHKTVEAHLLNIREKTGLGNRVILALWWDRGHR